ncbi:DUF6473 family protein [Aphanothece minutissima]|uniref:DUF6473 domain-containing protein n=1 Tax=Aphanothece cf. minutissima CCALA 015 TaxID=2107695 RepID=A0ABX5FA38_9CHRO|nr:DUF6473 family protein [Aphanothece minutissima]PSB37685.1 hypothetical protein C7B81_09300 [Aphanothece cf. minutissima CCALA 015]
MGKFYQARDKEFIDYQLYLLDGLTLRGPQSSRSDGIAYLGAAQTFGTYCEDPFPTIIGRTLGVGTMNLGRGGAGPDYYLSSQDSQALLGLANQARLVVVQVMSGRSINNSVFFCGLGASKGHRLPDGQPMRSEQVWSDLFLGGDKRGDDPEFIEKLIEENSRAYVEKMVQLLNKISVPKILFWFSERAPESYRFPSRQRLEELRFSRTPQGRLSAKVLYKLGMWDRSPKPSLLGKFPHLVTEPMLKMIRPFADAFVECSTAAGMPQPLLNSQGIIVDYNRYYPSPEMHQKAAEALLPSCQAMLT